MTPPGRAVSRPRLVVALVAAILLVLAAPFVGIARSELQKALPGRFALVVYALIGGLVVSAISAGLARVRTLRVARAAAFLAAALVATAWVAWTGSADPSIRAVEAFHFVEYGAITYLLYGAWRHLDDPSALVVPALAAFIVGIVEEAYQWFLPARVGELNDVWLNGVAILCGLVGSVALAPPSLAEGWGRETTGRVCRMLAAVVVALAAFVQLVHLGVEIRDGNAVFVSRFTAPELARVAEARQVLWRADPPLVRPDRLSREDQFMTEALQHVQRRNTLWTAGDAAGAWQENAILERHFAVVLDTPSYVSKTGHRWPQEQRLEAETRARSAPSQPFRSEAYPYPIYTWSPATLWAVAIALAALLWTVGRAGRPSSRPTDQSRPARA